MKVQVQKARSRGWVVCEDGRWVAAFKFWENAILFANAFAECGDYSRSIYYAFYGVED